MPRPAQLDPVEACAIVLASNQSTLYGIGAVHWQMAEEAANCLAQLPAANACFFRYVYVLDDAQERGLCYYTAQSVPTPVLYEARTGLVQSMRTLLRAWRSKRANPGAAPADLPAARLRQSVFMALTNLDNDTTLRIRRYFKHT